LQEDQLIGRGQVAGGAVAGGGRGGGGEGGKVTWLAIRRTIKYGHKPRITRMKVRNVLQPGKQIIHEQISRKEQNIV
jgi:hypothetical protein